MFKYVNSGEYHHHLFFLKSTFFHITLILHDGELTLIPGLKLIFCKIQMTEIIVINSHYISRHFQPRLTNPGNKWLSGNRV